MPSGIKAYENSEFMSSSEARPLRILAEYLYPLNQFDKFDVESTIVFFGSARIKSPAEIRKMKRALAKRKLSDLERKQLFNLETLSRYYREASQLAYRLTRWSKALPRTGRKKRFVICSGGGSGIMEAANRGASLARGLSIGMNISLPFEQKPNRYITPSLCFDFNYFFMRKYWLMNPARALVIFPGGFGTMDELFELLTLVQTKKAEHPVPIVIYGMEYWRKLMNFEVFVEWGMISPEDLDLIHFSDSVDDAFDYLTSHLVPISEK